MEKSKQVDSFACRKLDRKSFGKTDRLFIHLLQQCLLSSRHVSGTLLSARDRSEHTRLGPPTS